MLSSKRTPLFILEMANNHMGCVEHGLRILREMREVTKDFEPGFTFGFKLQYRCLETFIHPAYRDRRDLKYVKRFLETELKQTDLLRLRGEMRELSFQAICTPFDEASVDLIEEHDFDVIKIASCSLGDWPLLERIAKTSKPIIASTAGAALCEIDKAVSFFKHRSKDLSVLHCVAEYPTRPESAQMNQLDVLRLRYPGIRIGHSTHESPSSGRGVTVAIAKGASIFEKHVGVATAEWPLNAYSASPEQVRSWLTDAVDAFRTCGVENERCPFTPAELNSLQSLRRAAFAKRTIRAGERVGVDDIFLALPGEGDQLTADNFGKYTEYHALTDIEAQAPIHARDVTRVDKSERAWQIVQRVRALLHKANVVIPVQADFEISHHYGLDRFEETGAVLITLVNREYCKKLIALLPGQSHPEHCHKQKEETFLVVHGSIIINLDGVTREYRRGDLLVVGRGARHSFRTTDGVVMEELSSTHQKNDSYYTDPDIAPVESRKTVVTYWLDQFTDVVPEPAAAELAC